MDESLREELEQIRRVLEEHERRLSKLEEAFETKSPKTVKRMSIREFLNLKKPKTDVDKTLAICYYLEKYENIIPFTRRDIMEAFKKAREKVPANVSDAINKNIKKGFIDEVGKKEKLKAYQLTNSGEKFVENDFKMPKE